MMKTTKEIVQTSKVYARCDACQGKLVFTGHVNDKNPFSPDGMDLRMKPRYEHVCSVCQKKYKLDRSYPYIEFDEVR